MCASSIGLLTGVASLPGSEQPLKQTPAGWRHLSYPAAHILAPDWLRGWDRLHSKATPDPPAVPDPVSLQKVHPQADLAAAREFGISLFGIVSEVRGEVYCLYDSARKRWIRLASGQADPVSEIRIRAALNDEVVEDLVTGDLFRIDRDQYRLVPIKHEMGTDKP